jgi:hypothetical protein
MSFTKIVVPEVGSPCLNFDAISYKVPPNAALQLRTRPCRMHSWPESRSRKLWHLTLFLPHLEARAFRVESERLLRSAVSPLDW